MEREGALNQVGGGETSKLRSWALGGGKIPGEEKRSFKWGLYPTGGDVLPPFLLLTGARPSPVPRLPYPGEGGWVERGEA